MKNYSLYIFYFIIDPKDFHFFSATYSASSVGLYHVGTATYINIYHTFIHTYPHPVRTIKTIQLRATPTPLKNEQRSTTGKTMDSPGVVNNP